MDGSNPKSYSSVATHPTNSVSATHTTNGILTQKLFINPTIQAVVQSITLLIVAGVEVAQESLSPRQTSLPQANVTDAARLCAHIFRTTGNISGTERDHATPRDASSSETRSRASCQSRTFVATSVSPTQIGNQDIFSPSNPSTARRGRNAEPFKASINGFSAVNEHSVSCFSGVSGVLTVSDEVAEVNLCERMNFASYSVFGETPKFVDLGLSPAHTADKLKSIFALTTRAGELTDKCNRLRSRHCIAEVRTDRVSEAKAYSDYTKISEFETMNVFERGNNSETRLNQNIQMTQPDQNIS